MTQLVEKVAAAMYELVTSSWKEADEPSKVFWRDRARTAIAVVLEECGIR